MMVPKQGMTCRQYSRDNHKPAEYNVKTHFDGTVLHVMGNGKEHDKEVISELSANFNICCDNDLEELMFIYPHMHSPEKK